MKKLLIIVTTLIVLSSCATTKETRSSRSELRKDKRVMEQAAVKQAVESRRFIIKLNRMYFSSGGMIDLLPRANYIIVDGEKTVISAAYMGSQLEIKPIAGINMRGKAINYELTNNVSKGIYKIKMRVIRGGTRSFDVYITIDKNGYCRASINSLKIDNVSYSGYFVPLEDNSNNTLQNTEQI